MPLMTHWSDALCDALDQHEPNLAEACGLKRGTSGPEFETNLGLLLRWARTREIDPRFDGLGSPHPGEHPHAKILAARNQATARLEVVSETINRTLFEQFGQARIDDELSSKAYGGLLDRVGRPDLIVATTNYDRAAEPALLANGYPVNAGFKGAEGRLHKLEPSGMVANRDRLTPVIHLHGAVGWYLTDSGDIVEHPAELQFIDRLGTPVVLYPDPDKDPTNDSMVDQLWGEFDFALKEADAVLVIGHSLHDPPLVEALSSVSTDIPVYVSFFNEEDHKQVRARLPEATPFKMEFGPDAKVDNQILAKIRKRVASKDANGRQVARA